jgi:flagellar hook-length control protein FliK
VLFRSGQLADEAPRWATTLHLTMPHLGALDATIRLAGGRLQLQMNTATDSTAASLRSQLPELVQALEQAGMSLQSAEVRGESA